MRFPVHCKKLFFLTLVSFTSLLAKANDVADELTRLVNSWNELHNTRETKQFKELYGEQVLFYGKYRKGSYCGTRKAKFLNEDFSQRIISPIKMQFFSSGTVKCSFTKEVTFKQLVKQHPSYLLFKEVNGVYHITGESDLDTDEKLHVKLDLGTELPASSQNSHTGLYAFLGVLLVIAAGSLWIYKRRASKRQQKEEELSQYYVSASLTDSILTPEPSLVAAVSPQPNSEKVAPAPQPSTSDAKAPLSHKEKGDAFENYVLNLFDLTSGRFRLIDWRSDKMTANGHYALSNHHPDIVLELKDSRGYHRFAIECKWRSGLQHGKIEWAKEYQIRNYKEYQDRQNMPVFVVIGLGGSPAAPERLSVVELDEAAKYTTLFHSLLKKYDKYPTSSFFYDPNQRKLY